MTILEGLVKNTYVVTKIHTEEAIMRRLETLGINEGTKLTLMNRKRNGASIIKVRGTRWAIGRDIAAGIFVEDTVPKEEAKG